MTVYTAFSKREVCQLSGPPPNFGGFSAFFALFFTVTALPSFKRILFIPLPGVLHRKTPVAVASGLLCSEYTQADCLPNPFSGGCYARYFQ
jgi:hypothetical protein